MINRKTISTSLLLLTVVFSLEAEEQKWGVSVGFGAANVDESFSIANQTGSDIDDSDTSFKWTLQYQLNEQLNLSFGYVDLGEASASFITQTTQSQIPSLLDANANAVPILPNGFALGVGYDFFQYKDFSFGAQIGLFDWKADTSASVNDLTFRSDIDGTDIFYGLKVEYDINSAWAGFVTIQRYQLDPNRVNEFLIGATYRF